VTSSFDFAGIVNAVATAVAEKINSGAEQGTGSSTIRRAYSPSIRRPFIWDGPRPPFST
jgi:hypothetical protein